MSSKIFFFQLVLTLVILPIIVVVSSDSGALYNCDDDWECGEDWISKGRTLLRYYAKTDQHLSFQKNEEIYIISKPKDKSLSEWVGKIGDRIGYVPKDMVREDKVNKSSKKQTSEVPNEEPILGNESLPPTVDPVQDALTTDGVVAINTETDAQPVEIQIESQDVTDSQPSSTTENPSVESPSDTSYFSQPFVTTEQSTLSSENQPELVQTMEQRQQEILPEIVYAKTETKTETSSANNELPSVLPIIADEKSSILVDTTSQGSERGTGSGNDNEQLQETDNTNHEQQLSQEAINSNLQQAPRENADQNLDKQPTSQETAYQELQQKQVPQETVDQHEVQQQTVDQVVQHQQIPPDAAGIDSHQSVTPENFQDLNIVPSITLEQKPSTELPPYVGISAEQSTTEPPVVTDKFEPVLHETSSTTEIPAIDLSIQPPIAEPIIEQTPIVLDSVESPSEAESVVAMEQREQEIIQQVVSGAEPIGFPPLSNVEPLSVEPKVEEQPEEHSQETVEHDHDDHHSHHHHHHHHHRHDFFKDSNDSSSVILVIKHLSSTLLSFLPEPLQDTILDVDDALVFTGIIALTLVSICVPYFLIEGYMSVRPLKKKVVELNKSLWKVNAAYETQQEEFEIFKQKAIAHDEFKKRAEQSGNDVVILKKLENKHREQITALKTQLKSQMKEAVDIRALIEKTLDDKKAVSEECGKYKGAYENVKEALTKAREELANVQTHAKSSALQLGMSSKNAEMLTSKIAMLAQEMEEIKSQLQSESEKRKAVEKEKHHVEQSKVNVEKELVEIKSICHQYEGTVSGLNEEISKLESELATIKETLGEDSPLLEVAEIQAKAAFSEKEADSLRTRLEGLSADNENLNSKLKETNAALEDARSEREQTNNRLQVLETYFKEREEEYIKTIEQLQLKESVRDKGKEELIRIIEEKENVCKDLNERLEALKEEFEETKQQHRNDLRSLEAKGHENWLSLCQAERKAQDARKEAELLRQRLTAISKEKDDEDGDGLNGEVPMFPIIPHELVPLPILDEPPSYFGLGDFVPPPPLPEGEEREPHRPPPLGGRLSPSFSDLDDNILSPIGVGRREDDCTDGSSGTDSPRRSPSLRGGWVNVQHDRGGQGRESMRRLSRATSSPIQPGANL